MKNGITITHAAEILNVSVETLRNWDRSGKLKAERDAKTGYRVYHISELEAFAERTHLRRNTGQKLKLVL
jgi:excisionase family DNA binding protein